MICVGCVHQLTKQATSQHGPRTRLFGSSLTWWQEHLAPSNSSTMARVGRLVKPLKLGDSQGLCWREIWIGIWRWDLMGGFLRWDDSKEKIRCKEVNPILNLPFEEWLQSQTSLVILGVCIVSLWLALPCYYHHDHHYQLYHCFTVHRSTGHPWVGAPQKVPQKLILGWSPKWLQKWPWACFEVIGSTITMTQNCWVSESSSFEHETGALCLWYGQ